MIKSIVIDIDTVKEPPYALTEEALEIWIKFWQSKHEDLKILSVDHWQLAAYCQEMGLYYRCRRHSERCGVSYETDSGNFIQYPEISTANNALNNAKALAKDIGLSPMARKKLGLVDNGSKKVDPFAALTRKTRVRKIKE